MSIQEIGSKGKEGLPGYVNRKQSGNAERFQESLMQNLKSQEQENTASIIERAPQGVGMTGNPARIRVNEVTNTDAVQTTEVRHMSYEESDNIEIAVTEGYTLKGKLEGHHVYVEAKYDDGRLEAYHVDTDRVQERTEHRIEQFALETIDSLTG
ncbi:MAG: hypothetical protein K2J99_06835 [Lachnospiraceae bacterium]|nr:hypothetical protein [Lachnospiraceae bacterium]